MGKEDDGVDRAEKQLKRAIGLCLVFMICEVIGGIRANSLAILTDAGHLLSDLVGFLISLFCLWLAKSKRPTRNLSFGFKRAEVIGAVLSVSLIWMVTVGLVWEAIERTEMILNHDPRYVGVNGQLMFVLACLGLLCNLMMMKMLGGHGHAHFGDSPDHSHSVAAPSSSQYGAVEHGHSHSSSSPRPKSGEEESFLALRISVVDDEDDEEEHGHEHAHAHHGSNLNVEAAYIHALGDMLQSVGVLIAASLIWAFPNVPYIELCDPLTTFLFSVFVMLTTVQILKTAINVLMQGMPNGLDAFQLQRAINGVPGVMFCYDLHVWSLSVGDIILSVHVVVENEEETGKRDQEEILSKIRQVLDSRFGIKHSTCQMETKAYYDAVGRENNPNCHAFAGTGDEV